MFFVYQKLWDVKNTSELQYSTNTTATFFRINRNREFLIKHSQLIIGHVL